MKNTNYTFRHLTALLFVCLTISANASKAEVSWSIICPPNVTVDCNDEIWDLTIYGDAYIQHHGNTYDAGHPTVHYYLNSCGSGYITRTWSAEDPYWNWISCTQTIYVGGGGNFGYHNIDWPADTEVFGCNPNTHPNVTGKPSWDYVNCSMIGSSYRDMVFTVDNGCKKIMRTWTLMDWCSSGGHTYPTWTHRQWIIVSSDEVPEYECLDDIVVSSKNCKNAYVDAEPWHIDPSVCGGYFTITNNSPYSTSKGADISGTYPIGITKVKMTVKFGCGMKRSCWVEVKVKKDTPPTPICLSQVNIALMGIDTDHDGVNDQGMVDIWAKDLDWKSEPSCHNGPLNFSFAKDSIQMFRTFTCDHLGKNEVKMYVSDHYGNQSYCWVTIDVQNNSANITPCIRKPDEDDDMDSTNHIQMRLSGQVLTASNEGIEAFDMTLSHQTIAEQLISTYDTTIIEKVDSFINYSGAKLYFYTFDTTIVETIDTIEVIGQETTVLTDTDGAFTFDSIMQENEDYMLKCGELDLPIEGVNNKDLEVLTEFILGNRQFQKPEEFLAADINGDKVIDLGDLSLLIDFIKGDITSFTDSDWIVYYDDGSYETNPAAILSNRADWIQFDSVNTSIEGLTFKAVQKGDIIDADGILTESDLNFRSTEDYLSSFGKGSVSVYPNPFDDIVNIEINALKQGVAFIEVFDIQGRHILQGQKNVIPGSNNVQLSFADRPESILFYKIHLNKKQYSGKLLRAN